MYMMCNDGMIMCNIKPLDLWAN